VFHYWRHWIRWRSGGYLSVSEAISALYFKRAVRQSVATTIRQRRGEKGVSAAAAAAAAAVHVATTGERAGCRRGPAAGLHAWVRERGER